MTDKTITGFYNGYTVEVSGKLPQVATLSLTSVNDDSAQKLVTEMADNGKMLFACDIKVLDENGNEWQPENGEDLKVTVLGIEAEEEDCLKFLHVEEDLEKVLALKNKSSVVETINNVVKGEDGKAVFPTPGFSTFIAFTGTVTVDSTTTSYRFGSSENVKLSEILERLNVAGNIANVTAVTSASGLLTATKSGTEWLLTATQSFATETLTVRFSDGSTVDLTITNAVVTTYITETVTIGTLDNSPSAVGGPSGNIVTECGLTIGPGTSYSDADPDTVDRYTIRGSIAKGYHLTIKLAGHIQLNGTENTTATDQSTIVVSSGAKLTLENAYDKDKDGTVDGDVYMFRGDITSSYVNNQNDPFNMITVLHLIKVVQFPLSLPLLVMQKQMLLQWIITCLKTVVQNCVAVQYSSMRLRRLTLLSQ